MCGRAGRKGVDDTGHAVLICNQQTFKKSKSLMTAETELVKSQLDVYKLRRTLLESVGTGSNPRTRPLIHRPRDGSCIPVIRDGKKFIGC